MGSCADADACPPPAPPRRDRRRPRRPDGRRSRLRGRHRGPPVRGQGLGRPQVPDRRQGRAQPHPFRAAPRIRCALSRARARGRRMAGRFRCRSLARVGARFRHRNLRRQLRPRVPDGSQGGTVAARLGAAVEGCRRAVPRPPPLARLERRWHVAFRDHRWRSRVRRRGRGAGAGRRQLAATGLRQRMGRDAGGARHRHRAAAIRQLRLRHRLERIPVEEACRRAAEAGDCALARWRRYRTIAAGRVRADRGRDRRQPGLCHRRRPARCDQSRRRDNLASRSRAWPRT